VLKHVGWLVANVGELVTAAAQVVRKGRNVRAADALREAVAASSKPAWMW
jgi:hypothetical protein